MTTDAQSPAGRSREPLTVVSFHAHPDDEALLTGGTLAQAANAGHRVVLVTATSGERGLAGPEDGAGSHLAHIRLAELHASAKALGCDRVVVLGYADSGLRAAPGRGQNANAFAWVTVESAAQVLAEILREEAADVLTIYDRNGGYGHPDHVQVHRVGTRAAQLAGTLCVLEATAPGSLFRAVLRALAIIGHPLGRAAPLGTDRVFSERSQISHRIRVTAQLEAKRTALSAHASQRRGSGQARVLDRLLRLPRPLFALVFGHEWFIERGGLPAGRLTMDLFSTAASSRCNTARHRGWRSVPP